jgi:hypothetical protein
MGFADSDMVTVTWFRTALVLTVGGSEGKARGRLCMAAES